MMVFSPSRLWRKTPYGIAIGGFAIAVIALSWTVIAWTTGGATLPGQPDIPADAGALNDTSAVPVPGESRVRIEKIGVDMPIVEGKDESVLLQGAWRSPFGSTPDKGGKTVLFGHRWLHKPPHPETFYDLDKLAMGDTITVDWEGKTYTYRVVETKVVSPKEISVLEQTAKPMLTLITCTPLYSTKQRLVIHAELVE